MHIVITHNNMDFDALAAQFGVTKLYPATKMVLGYPLVGNVRDFLSLYRSSLPIAQSKYIDLDEVARIFIVDCQHFDRIDSTVHKHLSKIEKWPDITVFDHHHRESNVLTDKATEDSIIKPVGSATSIVVEQIIARQIELTAFEATVLALGIYEDTGSLTHKGTTELDAKCVAYLLKHGADLEQVNAYVRPKLTLEQTSLLENLLSNASIELHEGVKVVTSHSVVDHYVDGLASLTRKLMEVLSSEAAFSAVFMKDRIHLVGRSESKDVDVGKIARYFGGDGHKGAGSAVIKEGDSLEIIEKIQDLITAQVKPQPIAAEIMRSPVRTVKPSLSMEDARRLMIRYGVDGFIVTESGDVVGVVTRRDIDQAMHHKLGHAPVRGFMSKPVVFVRKDTPLDEIQHLMVAEDIGRLPVLDEDKQLVGQVTRQTVLDTLYGTYTESLFTKRMEDTVQITVPEKIRKMKVESIQSKFEHLEPETKWLCETLGQVAQQHEMEVYAVGGFVRDLILERDNYDLDFVVEGSACQLAKYFELAHPSKLEVVATHERFNTATIIYHGKDKKEVDLSTARTEFYEYPAALPTVEPSKLEEDLYRRDFTINTLAVCLNPDQFGKLTDTYDGLKDLNNKVIRILHPFSFIEDPTRIVRAARFAARLGFKLSTRTRDKAREAVAMGIFDNLGGVRLRDEIKMILESDTRMKALHLLEDLGGCLRFLHANLTYDSHSRTLLRRAERFFERYSVKDPWIVYLGLLVSGQPLNEVDEIAQRLHLSNLHRDCIVSGITLHEKIHKVKKRWKRSEIYFTFKGLKDEALAIAACLANPGTQIRRMALLYITELLDVSTHLTGNELVELGVPHGPQVGKLLELLHTAKLDGKIDTVEDEKELVSHLLSQ